MKNFSVYLFFLLLLFPTLTAFSQEEDKVDIFGYYNIVKPTKDFIDISEIHLSGNFGENENPPFYGLIRLRKRGNEDFRLLTPTLTGKNLKFTTTKINGIYYKFDGNFTKLGNFPILNPWREIILTGNLTKYKGKIKIALAKVKLAYDAGD